MLFGRRDDVPGDPPVRPELGLHRPDRRLRRLARRRPPAVYAKGDRSNPKLAAAVAVGGLLVASLLAALLVTTTNSAQDAYRSTFWDRWRCPADVFRRRRRLRFRGLEIANWVNVTINVLSTLLVLAVLRRLPLPPRRRPAHRGRRETAAHPARPARRPRLAGLLRAAPGEERDLVADRQGRGRVPRRRRGCWPPATRSATREALPGAIEPWLAEARAHGWIPAVMGASEEAGTVYSRHGLDALELGDEAIVETAEFTLEGRRRLRTVRQAYNRVEPAGYEVRIRRHEDIPADEMAYLLRRADDWRDGATERGFSMALGRLGDPSDGQCVMSGTHGRRGGVAGAAVLRAVGAAGLSLDLMRRDRDAENGLMEFMVIELLRRAQEIGITQVSLNFAMFRSASKEVDASVPDRSCDCGVPCSASSHAGGRSSRSTGPAPVPADLGTPVPALREERRTRCASASRPRAPRGFSKHPDCRSGCTAGTWSRTDQGGRTDGRARRTGPGQQDGWGPLHEHPCPPRPRRMGTAVRHRARGTRRTAMAGDAGDARGRLSDGHPPVRAEPALGLPVRAGHRLRAGRGATLARPAAHPASRSVVGPRPAGVARCCNFSSRSASPRSSGWRRMLVIAYATTLAGTLTRAWRSR